MYWWRPCSPWQSAFTELRTNARGWATGVALTGRHPSNFGDELTPLLVEAVVRRRVEWSRIDSADLVAVGSLIDAYIRHPATSAQIWGSGLRSGGSGLHERIPQERVLALRGEMTARALGVAAPLGDPGVLTAAWKSSARRGGRLLIPHFSVLNRRAGRQSLAAARSAGFRVVLPLEPPKDVFRAITAADFVVSNSLHALIMSDAAGVPAAMWSGAPGFSEPDFKYQDYNSITSDPLESLSLSSSGENFVLSQEIRERMDGRAQRLRTVIPPLAENLTCVLERAFT